MGPVKLSVCLILFNLAGVFQRSHFDVQIYVYFSLLFFFNCGKI